MIFNVARGRAQGNVLVTTLILMSMIVVLGLNAIESVVLEQRMFSGYRNQNIAFNAAENAIKVGEDAIRGIENPAFSDDSIHFQSWDQGDPSSFSPISVSDINWADYVEDSDIEGAQEGYLIQYLGAKRITGEEMGQGQQQVVFGSHADFFRLGAYGEGPQNARRVVDVVYATLK